MTLYGKQTELAKEHFKIGTERWPSEMIVAQALVKKAAARANARLGILPPGIAHAIIRAADEILKGEHDHEFPLSIWQSGSGTQFNMNVNEVIASRANEILAGPSSLKLRRVGELKVHPNDHVNMSQSTNDTVPTSIHISSLTMIERTLRPALTSLQSSLEKKARAFGGMIKIGRTHLMDAVPMTLGQEFSGYARQIEYAHAHVVEAARGLEELAIGGTALGTELNAPRGYKQAVVREINALTKLRFKPAKNLFAAMAAHDAILATSGALKVLALALNKIANDVRLLGSGPRAGLAEIVLPANEPGSSIMPGKVNPTQCEMVMMVASQVVGNDAAIAASASAMSVLDMQASKPLLAHALLQSIRLLADATRSFDHHCVQGITADTKKLREYAERSLMLVTALNKHIGYDKAAEVAQKAHRENSTLEEAAATLGHVSKENFRKWVDVRRMV